MKSLLVVLVLFFGWSASADVMASIGSQFSFEKNTDGHNYDIQHPLSLRAGYEFHYVDVYLEYTHFTSSTADSIVDISREHTEWLVWARHQFRRFYFVVPYVALGGGVEYDLVRTNFGSESASDSGVALPEVAVATGLKFLLIKHLSLDLEGRAAFSMAASDSGAGNSPNPLLGAGLNLAFVF